MQNQFLKSGWKSPFLIVFLYAIIGTVWIFGSDYLDSLLKLNVDKYNVFQTVKGLVFVYVTALILYLLINRQMRRGVAKVQRLLKKNHLLKVLFESQSGETVLAFDHNRQVLLHIGSDPVLGLSEFVKPGKTELSNFQQRIAWFDSLNRLVNIAFAEGGYNGELHVGDNWYEVTGKMAKGDHDSGILLLMFSDKTESKELLELNQIYKNEYDILVEKVDMVEKATGHLSEKLTAVFNSIPFPVTLHLLDDTAHCRLVEANTKALAYFRISPSQIESYVLNLQMEDDNVGEEAAENARPAVRNATFEKDGRILHLKVASQNMTIGDIRYKLSVYEDVSDEVAQTLRLDSEKRLIKDVLDHIGNGVMMLNANLECQFVNQTMAEWLGADTATKEKGLFELLNTKTSMFHLGELVGQSFHQKIPRSVELQLIKEPDRWFNLSIVPVMSHNEVGFVVLVLKDITLVKEQEQKFIRNILQAEESSRLKTIFLSNLSHEVRTPMNGILGFLDLLEMDHLSEDQTRYVELIRKSTDQLLNILNSMMEISQLETNQVELERDWIKVEALQEQMRDAAFRQLSRSGKNNIALEFNMQNSETAKVLVDQGCLFKVYNQLIDNAVKFTTSGSIEVGVRLGESNMRFWVKDTGIGIKQSLKDAVYLPFTSFGSAEGEVFGGIGLGLTIVKGLVALQSGQIDFESVPGEGSTFFVDIPVTFMPGDLSAPSNARAEVNQQAAMQDQMPIRIKKVLLIEDSFENSQLMRALLEQLGVEVVYAYDGITAIELFYESANIELVFCDIRLPDIDGFEVLTAIRRINPKIPVVANTAYVMNEDRKKCLEAGFNEYMAKPIMREDLVKMLVNPPKVQKV